MNTPEGRFFERLRERSGLPHHHKLMRVIDSARGLQLVELDEIFGGISVNWYANCSENRARFTNKSNCKYIEPYRFGMFCESVLRRNPRVLPGTLRDAEILAAAIEVELAAQTVKEHL